VGPANLTLMLLAALQPPAPPAPPPAPSPPAQAAPAPGSEPDIIVTGQRLRGEVEGNVQPEERLDENQIRAYGASNVGQLVDALAPQTRSGRGRSDEPPVVLVNGRRIAGFGEIRELPPEAIERIDILPEEVALRYGYRADQRVVNIVLKENFRAITAAGGTTLATEGGRAAVDADVNFVRIARSGRFSLDGQYQHADALTESERNLIQSPPTIPFDLTGNVGPFPFVPGADVDPALSAAAGTPVTVAAVPGSAATGAPTLAAFVPGANRPNVTDLGRFRTLLPQTDNFALNGSLNRTILHNVSATVNARVGATSSESRLGLPSLTLTLPQTSPFSPFGSDVSLFRYAGAAGPLLRESDGRTAHGGLTLDSQFSPAWRWTVTANYDYARSVTQTDTGIDPATLQARLSAGDPAFNPFAPLDGSLLVLRPEDRSHSISQSADLQGVFNGPLLTLPAGKLMASLTAAADTRSLDSDTLRAGATQTSALSRDHGSVQGNFDIPLTSRRTGFGHAIGDLSLNLNLELEHFSDFGTLRTLNYGVHWTPIPLLDFNLNVTNEEGAPSMQQLGDPVLATPNARVFDFTTGQTVDVTVVTGGNPALVADSRRVLSARLTIRPLGAPAPGKPNLSIIANYTNTRISDPIEGFPPATAEIEAAFPGRFVRDAGGRLLQIDERPVNFTRSNREELRWGVTFTKPFRPPGGGGLFGAFLGGGGGRPAPGGRRTQGSPPAAGQPAAPAPAPPAGAGPRGPGGGGGGPRGGGGGGRGGFGGGQGGGLQLSVFHTWRFTDTVLIRPGVPELDYLDGSAFSGAGGRPRHEIEAQAAYFRNGMGGFARATWRSGTRVEGGAGGSAGDLHFSPLMTVNLNLFADLGQRPKLVHRFGWLRGTQIQIGISNVFNAHVRVRDDFGATPISYQPDYLDPLGRTVRIGIRKLFF
jgi:hypothetical protein